MRAPACAGTQAEGMLYVPLSSADLEDFEPLMGFAPLAGTDCLLGSGMVAG
jgi:hypothetical protein